MTEVSKFWQDVELAYKQVSTDHQRTIDVESEADGLYANIRYEPTFDEVNIVIGIRPTGDVASRPELKVVKENASDGPA